MTRVAHAGPHRSARAALSRPRSLRKQKEYKVVLEAVTEKKRKLHSVVRLTQSHHAIRVLKFQKKNMK